MARFERRMDSPSQLEYAPAPPLYRRKRFRRVALLVVLCAVVYPGWRYGPRVWAKGRLLYAQRRCLNYAAPADRVVYESRQPQAAELLKRHGYYPLAPWAVLTGGTPASFPAPVAVYIPDELNELERCLLGAPAPPSSAVLFLHEMTDKAGRRRLVIVRRGAGAYGPVISPFDISATVYAPATLSTDLSVVPSAVSMSLAYNGPAIQLPTAGLYFYAGQIDPGDASHFTIRYEMGGQEGVVDGRLNDRGDAIDLKIVSGPAAPPSPWSSSFVR
jgi:hypothetical protein